MVEGTEFSSDTHKRSEPFHRSLIAMLLLLSLSLSPKQQIRLIKISYVRYAVQQGKNVQENVKTQVVGEMLTKFNALSFDLNTYRRTTNRGSQSTGTTWSNGNFML